MEGLTVGDFVLDSPAPFVRVLASTAKNPKDSKLRLRPEVVAAMRSVLPDIAAPNADPFGRFVVGEHVIPPAFAIEVGGDETAGAVRPNRIHAQRVLAPQMSVHSSLVERRESLMETLRALHRGLLADAGAPVFHWQGETIVVAGR